MFYEIYVLYEFFENCNKIQLDNLMINAYLFTTFIPKLCFLNLFNVEIKLKINHHIIILVKLIDYFLFIFYFYYIILFIHNYNF